ncbi:MAG TPA: glycoside hydrolase family 30 beta sandwich domain-containing protein, partial [Rhodothermales bacterium]
MRFSNVAAFVGVTVLLAITARCSAGQVDATVNLQPSQTYQTITGWEATAQAGQFECSSFLSYRDELLDRAVDELGVNRVRLEVKSGFENTTDYAQRFLDGQIDFAGWHQGFYEIVNDNGDPHSINWNGFKFTGVDYVIENVVLPLKQRLQARGENLFVNVNYVDFKTYTGLHNQNPEEYAEFVLATYLHMQQKYGLVPDAWEVILEPDNSTWTGTQIGQAIAAAAARLQANGFSPSFIAPSTVSMNRASKFIDDMMAVQGAKPYVREFSYHRYKEVSTTALNNIAQRAQQHGKQTAMLEHIGSGYEDLHEDLKVGMNSAWSQYTLAFCESPNTGAKYYNILNSAPYVQLAGHTHLLRHYFRYVRAGARRIGASSTRNEVDPLAFVNTDGKQVVVLKANSAANVTINGLPNGRYGVRFTEYQDPKSY